MTAALNVGAEDLEHARRLIKEGTQVEIGALSDAGTDLGSL